jgi:hypothetical protein
MPLFFFDHRDAQGVDRDEMGLDLPDFETAYLEAHRALIDIWSEARHGGRNPDCSGLDVRDGLGRIVLEIPLTEGLGFSEDQRAACSPHRGGDGTGQLIAKCNRLIADQVARLERLQQKGCDADLAKSFLATLLQTQALLRYALLIQSRP